MQLLSENGINKFYNEPLSTKKEEITDLKDEKTLGKKAKQKLKHHREKHEIETLLKEEFQNGKLLAVISSSPGQVGKADGYVLEGPELEFYSKKVQK
eukprot:EC820722.1.p1 GENE.EC820722.1~~EC820722.1.p1  ORF type:complete len:97 (+),score=46.10 EC820722.1:117-407(+)